jgi:hypothetical protein
MRLLEWFISALLLIFAAVFLAARQKIRRKIATLGELLRARSQGARGSVDFSAIQSLPPPVQRYFRNVLQDGQPMIRSVELRQRGVLRTSVHARNWLAFSATELVVPPAKGFAWNAKVRLPFGTHVRVIDAYLDGIGSGHASFLSALALKEQTNVPELNSGALHRYLAEAVWFPTALLPQSGVQWTAIDEQSALATLVDGSPRVTLVFRFNEDNEVTHIESDGRWGYFDGIYRQMRWEGHFSDYRTLDGMRVPGYGEVGWYSGDTLEIVWKGDIQAFLSR